MRLKERETGSRGHFDNGCEFRVRPRNLREAVVGLDGAEQGIAGSTGLESAVGGLG